MGAIEPMKCQTKVNDSVFEIEITPSGEIYLNGELRNVDFEALDNALYSVLMETTSYEVVVESLEKNHYNILMGGRLFNATVLDERDMVLLGRRGLDADSTGEVVIKSPMPGLIVQVLVEEGQTVQKGATIIILESMKMQNELKSPRDGTIQRISVVPGDTVEQNRILITLT